MLGRRSLSLGLVLVAVVGTLWAWQARQQTRRAADLAEQADVNWMRLGFEIVIDDGMTPKQKRRHVQATIKLYDQEAADRVRALLKSGADPNWVHPDFRWTLLAGDAQHNGPLTSRVLIDAGADVNKYAAHGLTPLMCAAYGGHFRVVELLVKSGADVTLRSKSGPHSLGGGKTALDLATACLQEKCRDQCSKSGFQCTVNILREVEGN